MKEIICYLAIWCTLSEVMLEVYLIDIKTYTLHVSSMFYNNIVPQLVLNTMICTSMYFRIPLQSRIIDKLRKCEVRVEIFLPY